MQFQLIATQGPAQLAFEVGHAPRVAVDAFVEDMEGAALGALGLLHGDVRVPHQRVGAALRAGMGDAEAGADQQAFAIDPIRFGKASVMRSAIHSARCGARRVSISRANSSLPSRAS